MSLGITNRASALFGLALVLAPGIAFSTANAAPTVVRVELLDPSADMHVKQMNMRADPAEVHSGQVTFDVTNHSKELIHEMVLVRLSEAGDRLPYNPATDEVRERETIHVGEVSDLPPGGHGSLTLRVAPGSYMLICNQPGHYRAGMHAVFTVEP